MILKILAKSIFNGLEGVIVVMFSQILRCKITENNSYTQVFATKIAQKAKYLTLSVYFHYVNDHFAAEPLYVGHSAVTPRAEPIAEHTKADAAAKSHDNARNILFKGLSMTAWQPYPPLFWRAQIEDSM